MFENTNDNIPVKNFINKDEILNYVTEEDIFELVFNFKPVEFDYVVSPFRKDSNPGCWFQRCTLGKLRFVDFANNSIIKNIKMSNIDCFDSVQVFYNLKNFQETLIFVKNNLLANKKLTKNNFVKKNIIKASKKEVEIFFEPRVFQARDGAYWKKYQISHLNLVQDKVFAVSNFKMINLKTGDYFVSTSDICYIHTDFENNKRKIHRPMQTGPRRFWTNCNQNDIYGINNLIAFGKTLIITKSYKDYRVLKNLGLNVIAFQNEGMTPINEILLPICERFTDIIVFFDNDTTGINAGKKLSDYINSFFINKSRCVYIPVELNSQKISDPSDFIHKKGKIELQKFLTNNYIK